MTCALYFVLAWNLERYPGKTFIDENANKNEYRKFDHMGTSTPCQLNWVLLHTISCREGDHVNVLGCTIDFLDFYC